MSGIQLSKKEIQNRLNTIKINIQGFTYRKYGVSIKYYSSNDEKPKKRIDYKANISLEKINGIGYVTIDKENIFYNQHEPDLINEIIATTITKSLYPLRTHINEKGISSNEIINHSEIIDRWHFQKNTIQQKYVSNDLENFINITDEKIINKSQVEASLQYDWFWNLFFHPKFINYGDKRTVNIHLLLSVIPYSNPLSFSGTQKIEKIPTDYHSFTIHFKSKELLAPSYFKKSKDEVLYMTLNVHFDVDLYHHFPMHTRAYFEVYSKDRDAKIISQKIVFTMYQLNADEYNGKTLSVESPFITGGLVKLPPNKWGFDNFENLENDW